jgi:stage V sporulation protein D (sporulation-specific penicillin-binding protein)
LQTRAIDQRTRDLPLNAMRGEITDTNGTLLATSKTSFGVYVRPRSVASNDAVARVLAEQLSMEYDAIYTKITKKGVSEVTIKKNVAPEVVEKIRAYDLNGVYFAEESAREYVYGDFMSQILGYVSSDGSGQSGIEAYYDKYLKGVNGTLLTETDLIGKELDSGNMYYTPATDGLQVTLTIDYGIQQIVENVMQLIMYQQGPVSARSIVLDCQTGAILALSSKPSVDLNNLPRDDITALTKFTKTTLLTDISEPGSTFKVLTAAASLEEASRGNYKGFSDRHVFYNNSRTRLIDGSKISCWSNHAYGKHSNQTLSMALNNSCNPIFTDIAMSLGKETFYSYLDKFGYGKMTGVDIAGEQAGLLVDKTLVTNGDLARIGFGQTIAVTALQLCLATAAAVNGGELMKPYIVKSISDANTDTVVKTFTPTVQNRAISKATSSKLALMLEDVVTNGSGKQAYIEGYRVGGKTGTAQKFADGKLAVGKYVSSFIGFFPANQPKYLALVIVDEPVGQSYGSVVAAPYAKLIFEQIINYKNLKPYN